MSKDDNSHHESCKNLLSQCEMFQKVPPEQLSDLANLMTYKVLPRNAVLLKQGAPSDRFFVMQEGHVHRKYLDPESKREQTVEYAIKARSINSMKIISGDPVYATVKCVSEECKVFEMLRTDFLDLLQKRPHVATKIAEGLCEEIRTGSKKYATPLLEQHPKQDVNIQAVSIAAGIESYYRSALNAILNARLTGVKSDFFPQMHIQVPTRIAYICGFKVLRKAFDKYVSEADSYDYPHMVRLTAAVAPGIIMTPISSILEASNAGHLNREPLATRWMRGAVTRGGREIIFGVGLNQLSDYFEERFQPHFPSSPVLSNAAGSVAAGVVSGYLSHVPHNLSTYKLMEPQRSYADLYGMFVNKSVPPVIDSMVESWPSSARAVTRTVFATLFPRGVMIRTTQIVGSFIILNGTINYLQLREHNKIQQALGVVSKV